jgi:hypothetical protein
MRWALRNEMWRMIAKVQGNLYQIPQVDGTTVYATEADLKAAYVNVCDRLGAGEDAPEEHWLLEAVRNSNDPEWLRTAYHVEDPEEHTKPIEDLSG